MKRTLSSTFFPLDLRKIIQCVAPELISYEFKHNGLKSGEEYVVSIYSDPTLEDGKCQYMEDEDVFKVFLCSHQHDLFAQMSDHVLLTRTNQLGPIHFTFHGFPAQCIFKHESVSCYDGCIVWSIILEDWQFDDRCYFGEAVCQKAVELPDEQRIWRGEEGLCKPTRCKHEDCPQGLFCVTHDGKHEEIHKN